MEQSLLPGGGACWKEPVQVFLGYCRMSAGISSNPMNIEEHGQTEHLFLRLDELLLSSYIPGPAQVCPLQSRKCTAPR